MGISLYKIKKWTKMLTGKSISHVNQGEGTVYSKMEVAGYYNDLTEKVTKDDPSILVPQYFIDSGKKIYFSIGIFQYGLAAYDLLLKTGEEIYKQKLIACSDWAVENQQADGGWLTFDFENAEHPYSAMAQGEAISMLVRAHIVTNDQKYSDAAERALDFMLKPLQEGGVSEYEDGLLYLYETTYEPIILNGWIFSLWGLYDYKKYTGNTRAAEALDATLEALKKKLPLFDIKYWSMYDEKKRICSPFYHKLHVAQLNTMYDLFEDEIYKEYADKWEKYQNSFWKPKKAFLKKAIQKITE